MIYQYWKFLDNIFINGLSWMQAHLEDLYLKGIFLDRIWIEFEAELIHRIGKKLIVTAKLNSRSRKILSHFQDRFEKDSFFSVTIYLKGLKQITKSSKYLQISIVCGAKIKTWNTKIRSEGINKRLMKFHFLRQ